MTIEPTDNGVEDTVDLDEFTELFNGTTKEPTPEVEKVDDEEVSDLEDEAPTDTDDTPEDAPDEEPEEKKPVKKVNRFQERINELTEKAKNAERALADLKAKQAEPDNKKPTQKTPSVSENEPGPDDKNEDGSDKYPLGEFDPKYIRDMARHTIDQEWTARKEAEEREALSRRDQEARDQLQEQWTDKLSTVAEKHEDFLEKTLELEETFEGLDPAFSDYLVQTIKSLEYGPEVLYHFANNLEEAKKFVKLGPLAATLKLGEYNSLFKGDTRKESKLTKAPPPPQVNKGSKTRMTVSPDTDDLDAFEKLFYKK